jgi:hypothetical protein
VKPDSVQIALARIRKLEHPTVIAPTVAEPQIHDSTAERAAQLADDARLDRETVPQDVARDHRSVHTAAAEMDRQSARLSADQDTQSSDDEGRTATGERRQDARDDRQQPDSGAGGDDSRDHGGAPGAGADEPPDAGHLMFEEAERTRLEDEIEARLFEDQTQSQMAHGLLAGWGRASTATGESGYVSFRNGLPSAPGPEPQLPAQRGFQADLVASGPSVFDRLEQLLEANGISDRARARRLLQALLDAGHGDTARLRVWVDTQGEPRLLMRVTDESTDIPEPLRRSGDETFESLAWGVDGTPGGRTLWVAMPVSTALEDEAESDGDEGPATDEPTRQLPAALEETLALIEQEGADSEAKRQAKSLVLERYQIYVRARAASTHRDLFDFDEAASDLVEELPEDWQVVQSAQAQADAVMNTAEARRTVEEFAASQTKQWVTQIRDRAKAASSDFVGRLARLSELLAALSDAEQGLTALLARRPELAENGANRWLDLVASLRRALAELPGAMDWKAIVGLAGTVVGLFGEIELATRLDRDGVRIDSVSMPVTAVDASGSRIDSEVDIVTDGGRVWHEVKVSVHGLRSPIEEADRQLRASMDEANWVGGAPPVLKWHFMTRLPRKVRIGLEDLRYTDKNGRVHRIEVIDETHAPDVVDPYAKQAALPSIAELLATERPDDNVLRAALAPLTQHRYGPYRIRITDACYRRSGSHQTFCFKAEAFDYSGRVFATFEHRYEYDSAGLLVATCDDVVLKRAAGGQRFASEFNAALDHWHRRSGVDRIEVRAHGQGGRVWAIAGFDWNPEPGKLRESIHGPQGVLARIRAVRRKASVADQAVLDEWEAKFAGDPDDYPTPAEVVHLRGHDDQQLGRRIMTGAEWHGVKLARLCLESVLAKYGQLLAEYWEGSDREDRKVFKVPDLSGRDSSSIAPAEWAMGAQSQEAFSAADVAGWLLWWGAKLDDQLPGRGAGVLAVVFIPPAVEGGLGHTVLLRRVVEPGSDGEPVAKVKVWDPLRGEEWIGWDEWTDWAERHDYWNPRQAEAEREPCRVIFSRPDGTTVQVMRPPVRPMAGTYQPPPNALPPFEVARKPDAPDKAKPRRGLWSRMGLLPDSKKQPGDRGDDIDVVAGAAIPAADDPTRTEVPLDWRSGPSSPEMLQAVLEEVRAKTRQWPSRRARLLAEGAILRTVPLVFPHIVRDHVPGKLVMWGSGSGDPEDATLRAVVLGGHGEALATVVLAHGQVSVRARIDPDGAADPDAQQHIKHAVSSLVKMPEATGTFVNPVDASEFALATASVVAQSLIDHAVTVTVKETGEDSYGVWANVFHEIEGELMGECEALARTPGHDPAPEDEPTLEEGPPLLSFDGRLGSVPFEGDSDLVDLWCGVNLLYGLNSVQVAEHRRQVRDESGDGKYDTVLGRAAFRMPPGDDTDVSARAAALKRQIEPLMKWRDKETDAKVTKAIAECLQQVSSPDAILTVLVTGKPGTTSWTVKIAVVVPGLTTAVRTIEQMQSTLFATHVSAEEGKSPDAAASRIIAEARDVSVIDPSIEPSLIEDRIRCVLGALNGKGMNVSAQRHGRRLRIDLSGGIDDARAAVETRGKSSVEMCVRFPSGIAADRVRGVVDSLTDGMADSRYRLAGSAAAVLADRAVRPLSGLEVTLKLDGELVVRLEGYDGASQSVSVAPDDHDGIRVTVERIERRRDQLQTVIGDASDLLAEIVAGNSGLEWTAASVADTTWSEAFATRTADGVRAKITLSSGPDGQCRIVPELFSDDTVVLLHDPVAVYGRSPEGTSSTPFVVVGEPNIVAEFFGSDPTAAKALWQAIRNESGATDDAVLGRAALRIQLSDETEVSAQAAALKSRIDPLIPWQSEGTSAQVTNVIETCLQRVASRSPRDAMLMVQVIGDPATARWGVSVVAFVEPTESAYGRWVPQINSTQLRIDVPAEEPPDDAASRIVREAHRMSVIDPSEPSEARLSLLEDRIRRVLDALNHGGIRVEASREERQLRINLTGGTDDARAVVQTDGTSSVTTHVELPAGATADRVRVVVASLTDGLADSPYRLAEVAAFLAGRSVQPLTGLDVTLEEDGQLVVRLHGSDGAWQQVSVAHDDDDGYRLSVQCSDRPRDQLQTVIDDTSALLEDIAANKLRDRVTVRLEALRRARQRPPLDPQQVLSAVPEAELARWQALRLTHREQQVAALHQAGLSLPEIGGLLGVNVEFAERAFRAASRKLRDADVLRGRQTNPPNTHYPVPNAGGRWSLGELLFRNRFLRFKDRLDEAKRSGESQVTVLSEAGGVRVELVEFRDGSAYVRDVTDTVDLTGAHIANRIAQTAAAAVSRALGVDRADPELAPWADAAQAMAESAAETVLEGIAPQFVHPSFYRRYRGMRLYRDMDEAECRRRLADSPDPDSPAGLLRGLVEVVAGATDSPYTARFRADTPKGAQWLDHGVPRRIVAEMWLFLCREFDDDVFGSDFEYRRLADIFRELQAHALRSPEEELADAHFIRFNTGRRKRRIAELARQHSELQPLITAALGQEFISDRRERERMIVDLARQHPHLAAEAKATLVRSVLRQHPNVTITGHDYADVDVDVVYDALRGLATALARMPDLGNHPLELRFEYPRKSNAYGAPTKLEDGRYVITLIAGTRPIRTSWPNLRGGTPRPVFTRTAPGEFSTTPSCTRPPTYMRRSWRMLLRLRTVILISSASWRACLKRCTRP